MEKVTLEVPKEYGEEVAHLLRYAMGEQRVSNEMWTTLNTWCDANSKIKLSSPEAMLSYSANYNNKNNPTNIPTFDLDDGEFAGVALSVFIGEDDEKIMIIYKGIKYILNDGYKVSEFIREYGIGTFYDLDDEQIISGAAGFLEPTDI